MTAGRLWTCPQTSVILSLIIECLVGLIYAVIAVLFFWSSMWCFTHISEVVCPKIINFLWRKLDCFSVATGTMSKPPRIWEISWLQSETVAQTRTQNRFALPLFFIKIMSESVKVIWIKVVKNFIIFPNMYGMPLLDHRNSSYELNTALLILHLVQKISAMLIWCCNLFIIMEKPLKAYSFVGNRWLMKEQEAVLEV